MVFAGITFISIIDLVRHKTFILQDFFCSFCCNISSCSVEIYGKKSHSNLLSLNYCVSLSFILLFFFQNKSENITMKGSAERIGAGNSIWN